MCRLLTCGLEDRGESGQRQLSPAADMPPKTLTAALCQRTNPLTRERAAREARPWVTIAHIR